MGKDTYYTYEEEYNAYKNRQAMRKQSILPYKVWVHRYLRFAYPHENIEERYEEAVERHKEILNTAQTGKF